MRKALVAVLIAVGVAGVADATSYVRYDITVNGRRDITSYQTGQIVSQNDYVHNYTLILSSDDPKPYAIPPKVFSQASVTSTSLTINLSSTYLNNAISLSFADSGSGAFYPIFSNSNLLSYSGVYDYTGPGAGLTFDRYTLSSVDVRTTLSSTSLGQSGVSDVFAVPEPASWALIIGGFGMVGTALRRTRRETASFA